MAVLLFYGGSTRCFRVDLLGASSGSAWYLKGCSTWCFIVVLHGVMGLFCLVLYDCSAWCLGWFKYQ